MRNLTALTLLFVAIGVTQLPAQGIVTATGAKKPEQETPKPAPAKDRILGIDQGLKSKEPVTTEIHANEAFFDSNKYMGVFSGNVKVVDPRFSLQADKLTVYVRKGENQGLEKAVAEGNVGVVRDRPDPNSGAPSRSVGRAETATYIVATGDIELKGMPRVQQGLNTQIATSPDTVMIINQNGQIATHGPSRTDIRQEPKNEEAEKKTETSPGP